MLTRSAMLATTLAVGLVAVVGSSALAVAFVPGNESGATQHVQAIAVADQDPAVGTSSALLAGVPVIVPVAAPISLVEQDDEAAEDEAPVAEIPTTDPTPIPTPNATDSVPAGTPSPSPPNGNNGNSGNGNSGNGNGNSGSGNGNSGQSGEEKKDKKAKKEKKDKEAAAEEAE